MGKCCKICTVATLYNKPQKIYKVRYTVTKFICPCAPNVFQIRTYSESRTELFCCILKIDVSKARCKHSNYLVLLLLLVARIFLKT